MSRVAVDQHPHFFPVGPVLQPLGNLFVVDDLLAIVLDYWTDVCCWTVRWQLRIDADVIGTYGPMIKTGVVGSFANRRDAYIAMLARHVVYRRRYERSVVDDALDMRQSTPVSADLDRLYESYTDFGDAKRYERIYEWKRYLYEWLSDAGNVRFLTHINTVNESVFGSNLELTYPATAVGINALKNLVFDVIRWQTIRCKSCRPFILLRIEPTTTTEAGIPR